MIKRNLIANYFGEAWAALMGIVFVPLYIKYLGIESYGLIGVFAILQAGLSLLGAGVTPTLSREMALFTGGARGIQTTRDLLRSVEIVAIAIAGIIISTVFFGAEWLASDWLHARSLTNEEVSQAIAVMGMVCATRFVEGIYRGAMIGLQRQVFLNSFVSVMATLRGAGAVGILAWVSPTIESFFIWQAVVSLLTLAILAMVTHQILPKADRAGRFSVELLWGIRHFAGGMLLISFSSTLLVQVDKILLSRILSLPDFGYYTFASLVAGSLFMLAYPAAQAWYPKFNQLYGANDIPSLTRAYHQGAQMVSVIMGSAAIFLIVFSETILELWTHDVELTRQTSTLVSILALGNLLNGLMVMPYHAQLAHGLTGLRVKVNFILVLIMVPAIFIVVPRYGAQGVAWTWFGLNVGYLYIGSHIMFRSILTTEKITWYIRDVFQPIMLTASVAIFARLFLATQFWMNNKLVMLIITFCLMIFAAAYAAPLVRQQLKPVLYKLLGNNLGK